MAKHDHQKAAVLVAVLLVAIAIASNSVPVFQVADAQTICKVSLEDLMTCRPAVTPPKPPPPTAACCTALSHADLVCLCSSYRNSSLLPSLGIDPKLALKLPEKCKIPHPQNC